MKLFDISKSNKDTEQLNSNEYLNINDTRKQLKKILKNKSRKQLKTYSSYIVNNYHDLTCYLKDNNISVNKKKLISLILNNK